MNIVIITLFPNMFDSFFKTSLVARSLKKNIANISVFDMRLVASDNHKTVDGKPFGGGVGMVLRVDIVDQAIKEVMTKYDLSKKDTKIILTTPQGQTYNHKIAKNLSLNKNIIIICGHYEGYDERIRDLVDLEISIGDFVLTGGELPAMLIIDSLLRFHPGFLGKEQSNKEESFEIIGGQQLLEYPQYTKPREYNDQIVPDILLSGDHEKIRLWRLNEAQKRTRIKRPDLLNNPPVAD